MTIISHQDLSLHCLPQKHRTSTQSLQREQDRSDGGEERGIGCSLVLVREPGRGDILIICCTRCHTYVWSRSGVVDESTFLTKILRCKAMPWLRGLVAGFTPPRPRPVLFSVQSMQDIWWTGALVQAFLQVLRFYPVATVPPVLHSNISSIFR